MKLGYILKIEGAKVYRKIKIKNLEFFKGIPGISKWHNSYWVPSCLGNIEYYTLENVSTISKNSPSPKREYFTVYI